MLNTHDSLFIIYLFLISTFIIAAQIMEIIVVAKLLDYPSLIITDTNLYIINGRNQEINLIDINKCEIKNNNIIISTNNQNLIINQNKFVQERDALTIIKTRIDSLKTIVS